MKIKTNDIIRIPANDVLGAKSEMVKVIGVKHTQMGTYLDVLQLTDVNGEPGDFWVDAETLQTVEFF